MATEAQTCAIGILANRSNAQESTGPEPVSSSPPSPKLPILPSFAQNHDLIMQNKPNLLDAQMNVSSVLTKDYENEPRLPAPGKQTQSNPISNATTDSTVLIKLWYWITNNKLNVLKEIKQLQLQIAELADKKPSAEN